MQKEGLHINNRQFLIISLLFYVFSVVLLSYLTNSTIDLVFVGTIPFLFYLILLHYLANNYFNYLLYWTCPVIFPMIFLFLAYNDFWILGKMDAPVVFVLNLMFSYLANVLFLVISRNEKTVKHDNVDYAETRSNQQKLDYLNQIEHLRKSLKHAEYKLLINKDNIKVSLNSIEDKCKSINFVIGRVYSDKRGGSDKFRHMIRIKSDLYNSFSEITKHFDKTLSNKLLKLLEQIYFRLKVLENTENSVFPEESYRKFKFKHDVSGKDRIIDVLSNNDNDPVKDYHSEAIDVCLRLGEYLKTL